MCTHAVAAVADIVNACNPNANQTMIDQADAAVTAAGLPTVFTTRTNKVLPDNGHGIVQIDNEMAGAIVSPTDLANRGG